MSGGGKATKGMYTKGIGKMVVIHFLGCSDNKCSPAQHLSVGERKGAISTCKDNLYKG